MSKSNQHRGLAVSVLFAAMAQVLWPAPVEAQNLPAGLVNAINQNGAFTPSVSTVGNTMTVTLESPRSIYNWTSFDVASGYTFNVVGASSTDLMVNRVFGGTPTTINGLVQSNANIWILNNAGIAVGNTGRFDVAGMLLSTVDITDADLFDGNLSFNFSGSSPSVVDISQGAQLAANNGGITLLGNAISMGGFLSSPGTNALFGARDMVVTFDANLNATTYAVNTGSSAPNAVSVVPGAAFAGTRNVLMAAGMTTGQGNVVLANPGGATDIVFSNGSVELISRDANVVTQGVFATPGDLTVNAGQMFQGNGGPTVGGNYSVTGQDFSGGVFNPVFVGTTNSLSIIDTQGGLTITNLSAPGDINVTSTNGSLGVSGFFGPTTSTNGNISLATSDSLTLDGDLVTSAPGHSISLNANGAIAQTAGTITTDSVFATAGSNITLGSLNNWNAASFANSGAGDITANSTSAWKLLAASSGGALNLTGPSIGLAGAVQAIGGMAFNGAVVLNGDTSLLSVTGNVLLDGTVDGGIFSSNLTVDAPGDVTFNGDVGAGTALTSLTVNGDSTFNGTALWTTGSINLEDVTLGGSNPFRANAGGSFDAFTVSAPNASVRVDAEGIDLREIHASDFSLVELNGRSGNVVLSSGSAGQFYVTGAGFSVSGDLDTARLDGSVGGHTLLGFDSHIDSIGSFSSSNGVTLRNLGSLLIVGELDGGTGDVRIEVVNDTLGIGAFGAVSGDDIALSSTSFLNSSGADALTAAGHWVVYQVSPGTGVYDSLDSGNTAIWGQTINTLDPSSITGNHYAFAFSPTLTFTTTDTTKTYGTDLSGSTGSFFAVTGYQPGVAGAYLGDTAASAFSGAPLLTSAGFAERASVTGGPYAIDIANGSLASPSGYQFAFSGAGNVTVDPKALTGTATTTTKTYDGNSTGSGTISLSGVVTGDTVDASGTFTFVDKNAGLGKTVDLTGATLTGTDAGNYTLTVPATTVGDILQRTITGTGSVDTKTYDGNATGSGMITLSGVVGGDDLGAAGTFTFSDKNAGIGKAVTLSGITLTGADAGNYTVTVPGALLADILQKAISGTVSVTTKTYDGNATGSGTVDLGGVVVGDDLAASATLTFSDKNAGTGKTVTVSGATLSGADAGNYTVTLPASALGDILQKAITGTATVGTKTYDGNTNGSGSIVLNGVVAGDDVGGSATFAFSDKNAGTGKTVTVAGGTLNGADAGNYTLTLPASVLGDILQKAITGTATVATKTYDGNTNDSGTVALSGVVAGDDVGGSATFTFDDKNAGADKIVAVSGAMLSGTDAGNYTVTLPASVSGDILQKAITGTSTVATKTYDGNAQGSGTITLSGVVAGDNLGANGTFTFSDKNAGTDKTVTLSGVTLSGADAGNYTLTVPSSVLGDILQKAITGTITVDTRTYDGSTAATGSIVLSGVVAGDAVGANGTFTYADKNAGMGKTVTVSDAALSGTDAGNYTVALPASALGDILQKAIAGTPAVTTKTYDGNATGSGTIGLNGVIAGDEVSASGTFAYADKNAGTGKQVTISGVSLAGVDAGNYTISVPASTIGDILRKSITGTATVASKTYDGNTAGTGSIALDGVVAGDAVGASGTYTFSDANAGAGQTVTVGGVTLTGADAGNYTVVVPGSTVADILRRAITVTADPLSKPKGGTDPALTYGVTDGSLVAGDTLSGALMRDAGENPGAYAIGQGTLSATANYQLTFVGATLTILPLPFPSIEGFASTGGDMAGVLHLLEGNHASLASDVPLEVVDERLPCEGDTKRSAACATSRSN